MKITSLLCCLIFMLLISKPHLIIQAQEDAPPPPPPAEITPPPAPGAAAPTAAPAPEAPASGDKAPASAAPEVQAEQLKWPDTIELAEEKKGLAQTSNNAMLTFFKNSKKTLLDADEYLNKMTKAYDDFSKKFDDINSKIDNFLQEASFKKGSSQEQITPSSKK